MPKKKMWSWGNYPLADHTVINYNWNDLKISEPANVFGLLPYGKGRSYGDVPLNDGGTILLTQNLDKLISFDSISGILYCEAGVILKDIISVVLPQGWFLPVTPGTQFVTIGGAIANDVHGKNHHSAGTFGSHVIEFELLRSDNQRFNCSPKENAKMYKATIGGLGLTGLITKAKIQLLKVPGSAMQVNNIPFSNVDEGLELFSKYDQSSSYSVAWIDCLSQKNQLGRGILTLAEHCPQNDIAVGKNNNLSVPFFFPGFCLNKWSVKAFNELYYYLGKRKSGLAISQLDSYFYPLDSILQWNKIYGSNGFFQHQCVIPSDGSGSEIAIIKQLLTTIAISGNASFLAVLKTFGDIKSPGVLSFPTKGVTLALDLPNKGRSTQDLLTKLDDIVVGAGGRIYPAKDSRMSPATFKSSFPNWNDLIDYIDPRFSSSFWRRVTEVKT